MSDITKPPSQEMQQGYALGMSTANSLASAVRSLAEKVNDHTILLMALMKLLKTDPEKLMLLMGEDDFVPADKMPEEKKIVLPS